MSGESRGSGDDAAGVVAFDNTGTLSAAEAVVVPATDDPRFAGPVPEVDASVRAALASVECGDVDVLRSGDPLGAVIADAALPVHVALSNGEPTDRAVRDAVLADRSLAARRVADGADELVDRVAGEFDASPPVGVQLVVDVDAGTIHRAVAYTTVPDPRARGVLDRVRARGYDPHIVSGDARHILEVVAGTVGVPAANVHAYRSAGGKAATVEALRAATPGPVVMVGDYVNDRQAFRAADRSVLVATDGDPAPSLAAHADRVAADIEAVPALL